MGVPDVEQAKRRLQDILRRAQKLEIPTQEVISTRTARKLLARTRNVLTWTIWIGVFIALLSGVVYARWPTRQDAETVRTVLRRTNEDLTLLTQGMVYTSRVNEHRASFDALIDAIRQKEETRRMQGNENRAMMGKRERETERENARSRARLHTSDARTSIAANRSSVHGGEDLAHRRDFYAADWLHIPQEMRQLELQPTGMKPRSCNREITAAQLMIR